MPDHAAFDPPAVDASDKTIEAKVVASSLVTLVASLVVAWLNALQAQPDLLGSLPPVWQFVILTAVPPVLAFAGGWAKTSNRV